MQSRRWSARGPHQPIRPQQDQRLGALEFQRSRPLPFLLTHAICPDCDHELLHPGIAGMGWRHERLGPPRGLTPYGVVTMAMRWVEMDDSVRLRTWQSDTAAVAQFPVVLVHGGPGLPDYLEPVATLIDDMTQVYRYDQRGTGGSRWNGLHTVARHVQDLWQLIDAWGHDRVVLVGHSYGTDLTSFFVRAHPERVARVVYLCGPFVGPWRDPTHAAERARRSDSQQARLEELEVLASRTDEEEIEYLALSWFTDHGDPNHAWEWAVASAYALRPINWTMNAQLNVDKRTDPLEDDIDRLREVLPASSAIIGGAEDPRPAASLRRLGVELGCDVTIIPGAGHHPWMERPVEFGAVLRGAVSRQVDPARR
jgi:pimeloyl-ACP methyl ester carboxylesterase